MTFKGVEKKTLAHHNTQYTHTYSTAYNSTTEKSSVKLGMEMY